MLTVQSVFDVVTHINLIDDLVGVFLKCCCEDDDLVVSCHRFDELHAARSHEEEAIVLILRKKGRKNETQLMED